MATIAVAIVFFQKLDQTISCINSFLDSGVTLYVLNNGSCNKDFENIKYFEVNQNLGPASGRNILINEIPEDWIVFADNDITVEPANWVNLLKNRIEANPNADVFIPRLYNVHERDFAKFNAFSILNN